MMPGESGDGNSLTTEGQLFETEADEIIVCDGCGQELTVGEYSDGQLCHGCREARGPEPEEPRDIWAESEV